MPRATQDKYRQRALAAIKALGPCFVDDGTLLGNPGHALTLQTVKTKKGRRKVYECTCGWSSPNARNVEAARDYVKAHHSEAFCPTPEKRSFTTQRQAELTLLHFWQTAPEWKKQLRRAYECPCGRWHTTSQPGAELQEQAHA
jgi:hypothetical protein